MAFISFKNRSGANRLYNKTAPPTTTDEAECLDE